MSPEDIRRTQEMTERLMHSPEAAALVEGFRFDACVDPTDERFEIITIRQMSGPAIGGPSRPTEKHTGVAAIERNQRFLISACAGLLADTALGPPMIALMNRIRELDEERMAKAT